MKCLIKAHDMTGVVAPVNVSIFDFVTNPSNLPKDKLPLWRFVTLKEGAPLKANQDNYDKILLIIMEFDKGTTIQKIEEMVKEWSYLIHTTSNHTSEFHRFRLMLPLDTAYPEHEWRSEHYKKALISLFPEIDRSSFVNYQKIPALPTNPADYYYKINSGKKFGYSDIAAKVAEIKLDEELDQKFRDSDKNQSKFMDDREMTDEQRDAYKAKVDASMQHKLNDIPQVKCGHRYNSLVSMTGSLLQARYPDGEIIYDDNDVMRIITSHTNEKAIICMIRNLCRRRR